MAPFLLSEPIENCRRLQYLTNAPSRGSPESIYFELGNPKGVLCSIYI